MNCFGIAQIQNLLLLFISFFSGLVSFIRRVCATGVLPPCSGVENPKNIGETIIIKANKINGVNGLNSVEKATNLKKK